VNNDAVENPHYEHPIQFRVDFFQTKPWFPFLACRFFWIISIANLPDRAIRACASVASTFRASRLMIALSVEAQSVLWCFSSICVYDLPVNVDRQQF